MAPDGPVAEETYAVILEAMKETRKVALAKIVLSSRERLVAIQPKEGGFVMTTLRAGKEVRDAADVFEKLNVKIAPDMLAMARQIIEAKSIPFEPRAFEDRYELALLALVRSKIAGGEPVITKAPERGNVINLMDALRRSIEEDRRPPAASIGKTERAEAAATRKGKKPAAAEESAGAKAAAVKKPATATKRKSKAAG
jgi:DNA end-binding protein Ku